jgi:hypothetical protein
MEVGSWRGTSVLATEVGFREGSWDVPNGRRAWAPETAYGCVGGAKL